MAVVQISQEIRRINASLPLWCQRLTQEQDWCILDTETTGKYTESAQIVEIAVIDHRGKPLISSLVKPSISIPEGASQIHGISDFDIANAPTFAQLWPLIAPLLTGKRVLVYNADYDSAVIMMDAKRYCVSLSGIVWHCMMREYAGWWREPGRYPGSPKWQSLSAACKQQGIKGQHWHSALADCNTTFALISAIASKGEQAPRYG